MAKIDPSKLTVDFKSLMRLSMTDRYALAQSSQGQSYLASLTPTQFAMLFPDYYRQRLPDMGISGRRGASAPSGAGSRPSGGTPSSGASTYTPPTAAPSTTSPTPKAQPQQGTEVKPSWQKRIEEILTEDRKKEIPQTDIQLGEQSKPGTWNVRTDVPYDGRPASVRYNNPGASWSRKRDELYGVQGYGIISGNNRIGKFPTITHGMASNMDLFSTSRNYAGKTLQQATYTWRGNRPGNVPSFKLSDGTTIDGRTVITPELLKNEEFMYRVFKSYAQHEAGLKGTISDDQIREAFRMYSAGGIDNYRKIKEEQQSRSALEKASTATPGDPSKTGTTEQTPLRPKTITTDPKQLEQLNRDRKHFYSGKLTMEGVEYTFGSGGRKAGSMPYGTFDITGLHRKSQYKFFENNSFYVKDMFDPKVGRNRVGMLIHSQTDLDKLYSAGCIAISRKEWPKFKAHLLDYMKRSGSMSITVNPDGTAYIGPKGSEPTTSVTDVTKDFPKLPQGVDPKEAMELEKRMPKDLNPQIVKYMKENMSIEDRRSLLDKLEKKPELLTELNGLAAKTIETKNSEPAKEQAAKLLTEAVKEDILPESVLDLKVKMDNGKTATLKEMGITRFSELEKKGGQAFAGGANDRNTTLLAGDIQQHFGENFGRVTAQNDLYHKSRRAPGTSHRSGRKLDFTLNDGDYRGGHKRLSKYLAEKYGMEEGKDFKIISRPHGTGPHMDFELTPSGGRKVSVVLEPRTEKETEVSREAALPAQEKPNKIFVAGLEDRGENFEQQSARMGPGTKSFRHNSKADDLIKYAQENPNAPITLFSAGNKHLQRLLDAGIPASRITMVEPYKPNPARIRSFVEQGGKYVYGKSYETGNFRGVNELSNTRQNTGSHFDAISPPAAPVQETPIEQASKSTPGDASKNGSFIPTGLTPASPAPEAKKEEPVPAPEAKKEEPVPAKYAGGEVQTRGDTATVINNKGEPIARINPDKERISLTETGNLDVQPTYRTDPRALEQQNAQRQEVGNINIDDRMQEMSTNIMNQVRQLIPQGGNPNWESMMTSIAAAKSFNESSSYTFSNDSFRRAMAGARFEKSGDSALGGHFEIANSNLT